jgi:hypothetical protein
MRAVCADQRLKVGASPGTLSVAPGSVRKAAERPDKDCRELFQGLRARSALDSGTIVGEHSCIRPHRHFTSGRISDRRYVSTEEPCV